MDIFIFAIIFSIIALASGRIGEMFKKAHLPLISGFLFTGILVGPYLLNLISLDAVEHLRFVDEFALAFIAFAAGNELYIKELKGLFNRIRWVTAGLVFSTFTLGSTALFLLADQIPFMHGMPTAHRVAIVILAGTILVARSPSSAIAVVNELRAKGPFTTIALGVTVIMDVVVISLFAVNAAIADALLTNLNFDIGFLLLLFTEMLVSLLLGVALGSIIKIILSLSIRRVLKTGMVLLSGYGVFVLSAAVRSISYQHLPFELLIEPLLVCMIGSFMTTNYSHYRAELRKTLHDVGPPIYVAFFTMTGASLALDVLAQTWMIALVLFGVRTGAIMIGSFGGGLLAGVPPEHNRIGWMCYITQAGVGLGLAKGVADAFPDWGAAFATIVISVIVLNQIVGPPLFKWAIHLAREAHPPADRQILDGVRDAVIFGLEGQSLALARSLRSHGWEVRIVSTQVDYIREMAGDADIEIIPVPSFDLAALNALGVNHAEAIVCMMADDENYQVCEIAYEHFGTQTLIVRLHNRNNFRRFHEFGALVVDPATAIVSLLDQFVRSPSAASLLLGMESGRDVIEFELRNPDVNGLAIRDLYLPLDVQILSVRRQDQILLSGGYTRLRCGDWLTAVGTRASLEQVILRFDIDRDQALFQMVTQATPKELSTNSLGNDVKGIINTKNDVRRLRFDALVENSVVLDIGQSIPYERFFKQAAKAMAAELDLSHDLLFDLMMTREAGSSTALRPDLAIPHIIIEGSQTFSLLLARCKAGIYFNELAPRVQAVFILLGTRDERNYHLYALSTIAELVQDIRFRKKWMAARDKAALRKIVLRRS